MTHFPRKTPELAGQIHELKTHLCTIHGFIGILQMEGASGNPPDPQILADIQAASSRALDLAEQLFDLPEAPLGVDWTDLNEILASATLPGILPPRIELEVCPHPMPILLPQSVAETKSQVKDLVLQAARTIHGAGRLRLSATVQSAAGRQIAARLAVETHPRQPGHATDQDARLLPGPRFETRFPL